MKSEKQKRTTASMEMVDDYSTGDIALASYLLAAGYEPKLEFRFCDAGLKQDLYAFDAGVAQIKPQKYEEARARLRQAIEALEDANHG